MRLKFFIFFLFSFLNSFGQQLHSAQAEKWADSVLNTLSEEEKIGQLMIARLSSWDGKTKKFTYLYDQVAEYIKKYNIGGVCIFQGSPVMQAGYINQLKKMAKTPILFSIDGEWGVGMRITDSVLPLPKQMMLGAIKDSSIVYQYGKLVAEQCKRMGIQHNYAPVMDVNNNPNNPVINDRSFGEDKEKVALYGIQYMKGMQDNGVLACAKHFPGHGDVAVDSHYDLPVINKTMGELDSTELYPFRQIFKEGVGSVMIGHLFIPAIDNRINRPTSLSKKNIEGLLRNEIQYQGLAVTDGMEMQGVKKFFPSGEAAMEAIIAGNDMLCLPDSIPLAIKKIKRAIKKKKISLRDIELHCKKVLMAKYTYVVNNNDTVNTFNLANDLNKGIPEMRRMIAENAITLVAKEDREFFPLEKSAKSKIAFVGIGIKKENAFSRRIKKEYGTDDFFIDFSKKNKDTLTSTLDSIIRNYDKVVIGIHQLNRAPTNNFGISQEAFDFVNILNQKSKSISFLFGNAYAAKNWCYAKNLVIAYEDDSIVHHTAVDMLQGTLPYKGVLPVTVCENLPYGYGLNAAMNELKTTDPQSENINPEKLKAIDSIALDAIARKAMPGCVVLVAKKNKIVYEKGFGGYTFENTEPATPSSVYDLASLTKILSTTISLMKLYEEGKIDLKKNISEYISFTKGTDKQNITIEQLLLHEGGLAPYIPFYKETLDNYGNPIKDYYHTYNKDCHSTQVANNLFLRSDITDTFYHRMLTSPVSKSGNYVYSDIDFIYLGKIVEQISGMSLDEYVTKNFYYPMGVEAIGYHPLKRVSYDRIVPSTKESNFRNQVLRGYVHDQGAAIMGGVAGHAGLFSDAHGVASVMQMLLNGGTWNGKKYLNKETIKLFTSYQSKTSRRGFGFDKPERNNASRNEPYPASYMSDATFGHTGFTGTCVWADPEQDLIFVFLSNRIYPEDNGVFRSLNIRSKILDAIYKAIK